MCCSWCLWWLQVVQPLLTSSSSSSNMVRLELSIPGIMHNSAGLLRVGNPFETKLLFLPDKLDKLYLLALPIHLSSSSSQELIILLLVEAEDSWECDFDYVMASRDPSRHWENETLFFYALSLWNIKERKHLEWNSIWKQNLIFITVLIISSMQRGGFWRRNCTRPYRPRCYTWPYSPT